MACVKNVKNVIKSVRGTINPYYDMGYENVTEIYRTNSSVCDTDLRCIRIWICSRH